MKAKVIIRVKESFTLGRFDTAKNFIIGGLSGMTATSCVNIMLNTNRFNLSI